KDSDQEVARQAGVPSRCLTPALPPFPAPADPEGLRSGRVGSCASPTITSPWDFAARAPPSPTEARWPPGRANALPPPGRRPLPPPLLPPPATPRDQPPPP